MKNKLTISILLSCAALALSGCDKPSPSSSGKATPVQEEIPVGTVYANGVTFPHCKIVYWTAGGYRKVEFKKEDGSKGIAVGDFMVVYE